jgi:hypothetical protein
MRTLSSTLLAAQRSGSAEPYVTVTLSDRIGGAPRLAWERLYTGAEADAYHAATVAGDGALIRSRLDPASHHLYVQRVAAPGPGSDFSQWTDMGQVSPFAGQALASYGSTVHLYYVATNQQDVYVRESADNGQTWGSPAFVFDPDAGTQWLAAAFNGAGVPALFIVADDMVYRTRKVSGSWTTPTAWTNSLATVTGIGTHYQGDWNVLVSGTDAGGAAAVWGCIFGDGGAQAALTWSPLKEVIRASAGADVSYRTPTLSYTDVHRAFFVEEYSGAYGAYSRAFWSHAPQGMAFTDNGWREAVPFDLTCDFGPALAQGTAHLWLSAPSGVWRAARAAAEADVTADVIDVRMVESPGGGRLTVTLRNDHHAYDDASLPPAVRLGAEVRVAWGYRTASGLETSAAAPFWVEGWERSARDGRALFTLRAVDGWGLLRGWRARRQLVWDAGEKTAGEILAELFTRMGLRVSTASASGLLTSLTPAFTVHPGEDAATAVDRLLRSLPDVLRFKSDASATVIHPQEGDDTDYAYGTAHVVLGGSHQPALSGVNWVQVYGSGLAAQEFLWEDMAAIYDRLVQVHDLNLSTQADAEGRAATVLRRAALETPRGALTVPVHCGQELYDVVEVTDPRLGLEAEAFRVVGIETRFRRADRAVYAQDLRLSAV